MELNVLLVNLDLYKYLVMLSVIIALVFKLQKH